MAEPLHPVNEILKKAIEKHNVITAKNEEKTERDQQFLKILREMSASAKAEQQRVQSRQKELKKAVENRERQRRINELRGLIAQLKQKLYSGSTGLNKKIAAHISMLQSELFWLMITM